MKFLAPLTVCIGFLFLCSSATCAVLYVEKDGTGDFTVIQDAVDAASDGDIIQIGPGRFNDYFTDPPWGNFRVWVYGDKSLTFIGSSSEETIIGPLVYGGVNQDWGIYCDAGSENIRIEGIRFENLDRMAVVSYADFFEMEYCVFETCRISCAIFGGQSTIIEDCQFYNCVDNYTMMCGTPHVYISDVLVQNCFGGVQCDYGGTNDILITDCIFDGGWGGVFFDTVG